MKRWRVLPAVFLCPVAMAIFMTPRLWSIAAQSLPASSSRHDGVITGRIVTDDGQPVLDAKILASRLGAGSFEGYGTECDDRGHFKLTALKPGAYQITATLPGYVDLGETSDSIHHIGEEISIRMVRGGVITGRVTDLHGAPLETVFVSLQMVRDLEGRKSLSSPSAQSSKKELFLTDDRGIYRIYELPPGVYVVSAIDLPVATVNSGSIPHGAPTYYPSARREDATEVTIRGGEVVTGIDIRHRGEQGHSITGKISGYLGPASYFDDDITLVYLINEATREVERIMFLMASPRFAFYGIPDGVYEIRLFGSLFSAPYQVKISGADITGLELKPLAAGSISGRMVIEPAKSGEGCGRQPKFPLEESFLKAKKVDDNLEWQYLRSSAVNDKGDFVQRLETGHYQILADLPGDHWYVRAITRSAKEKSNEPIDIGRGSISVEAGESISGIEVKVAEGAAGLRGRVAAANATPAKDGASSPPRWRIHLVPAEEAAADDLLRYAETTTRNDGTFELKHLAPGKYYLLARKIPEKEKVLSPSSLLAWDKLEREKLRLEAQSVRQEIELRPCQQATFTINH